MDQVNLQISENVRKAMDYAFDEAQQRLVSMNQSFDPFTVTVVDEGLEVNDHPAETPGAVRESVKMLLAQDMPEGYALCYDGYIEIDDGVKDALIAEGGVPGEDTGYAVSYLYEMDEEGNVTFEEEPAYVGEAPNFMIALNDADSYAEEDIDEKYLEEDAVDDEE